ncbi:MAG TPA: hypothetical protein VFW68_12320 [Rhodocyclaceae bacterium]|nr:hypothetical protein [Rhodocyclaceae bacterium]
MMRKLLLASSLLLGLAAAGCSNPNTRGSDTDTMSTPSGTSGYDKEHSSTPTQESPRPSEEPYTEPTYTAPTE